MRALVALAISLLGSAAMTSIAPSAHATETRVEIDRIEISGVTVFNNPEIESTLEVSPGDRLERARVVRTAENIQALYKSRGYEQIRIETRLVRKRTDSKKTETVLEINLVEGRPTRINRVRFHPDEIHSEALRAYWKKVEFGLDSRVGIKAGDVYEQEKISLAKRAIQDVLASEEFIGARVEDVKAVTVDDASLGPGRWIDLEFRVALGDRVSFGFRGNKAFNLSQLGSFISDQRVLGLGKDYISTIKERIEEEYRNAGYVHVSLTPYVYEQPRQNERRVTFAVSEGPRVKVESIDFEGNVAFSNEELKAQFNRKLPVLLDHGIYVEREVQKTAELVVEWLKSKGYLAAKVITINSIFPPQPKLREPKSRVRLVIYIYEGDQTIVQSISIRGATVFSDDEVKKFLGIKDGEPLNLFAFSEGVEALKAAYRAKGFLEVQFLNENTDKVIQYSQENRLGDVNIEINEGQQFKLSEVIVEGLIKTQEKVVLRELALKQEDVIEEPLLVESETKLRKLGIFSTVGFRLQDDLNRRGYKVIRISVVESERWLLAGGPGYRNDLGFRGFGQLSVNNLWGEGHGAALNLNGNWRLYNFNFPEFQAQIAYLWPWFPGLGETSFRPTISGGLTQYVNFSARTFTTAAMFERRILKKPNLLGTLGYSWELIDQFETPGSTVRIDPSDIGGVFIGSLNATLRLDLRDNALAPTRGFYLWGSGDFAAPWLGSQSRLGYHRLQTRADYHLPITQDLIWYLSARMGFERNNESCLTCDASDRSGAIPISKQFALGGPNSLRGFAEQELNLQTTDLVFLRGTASYVNYRTQVDLPLSGALRLGLFIDAANLKADKFSLWEDLRFGTGFGLHYVTPIGPVNLDWGFKVYPRPGEDTNRIDFSIGVI